MVTKHAVKARGPRSTARRDRASQAYRKLRELIVWGRLAPGTRIVEADVANRLGVSRTPVRSALHRLQQEGYIVAAGERRQSRLTVAPLTKEDARELFGIVAEVEALAVRWATELDRADRRRLVGELEGLNEDLLRRSEESNADHNAIFDADDAFHRHSVEAAAGPRLLALHDAIKPQAERYIRLYISALVGEISTSVEEHAAIIDAIQSGDPDVAQRAVQTNWRNAAQRLSRVIATLGERGSW